MARRMSDRQQQTKDRTVDLDRKRKRVPLWFPAKYRTTCHRCLLTIEPGDHVRFDVDNEVVHARHQHAEEVLDPPCPACFLVHKGDCL